MNKREKKLLIFLSIILIIFAYYYFVFQNHLDSIVELNDSIVVQESELKIFETSKTSIISLTAQLETIEEELREKFKDYLSVIKQEETIQLIEQILLRSEVDVTNLTFTENKNTRLDYIDYETLTVTVDVAGTYEEMVNFMSSFWRFDHNIFIQHVTMSPEEDLVFTTVDIVFVRVNNDYASKETFFEWYNDVFYEKESPFDESDFSDIFALNYFYTGTDVEFFNAPFEPFTDIIGHWAEEVINFFGRNGYVVGDDEGNIYPDDQMTRLETVLLLDLVFRWELSDVIIALETFDDYEVIASLDDIEKQALLKAFNSGYIFGYEDNTLRPYNSISYEELGYIGANLLDDETTWQEVAIEIRDQFGYISPGLTDSSLSATKAEIIYFLAYINQSNFEN